MNFLEKLQSAPEPTKRRWLVAATAVLMIAVIYVWLAYFNNLITAFSQPAAPAYDYTQPVPGQAGQPPAEQNPFVAGEQISFWQTLKNSVANLYEIFSNKLHVLSDTLNAPREYIIKPPQQ